MPADIIQLYDQPVATCPDCKCQQWFIYVNDKYDKYDKVTKYECSRCGFTVILNVEAEG